MAKKTVVSPLPAQHLTVYLLHDGVKPSQALTKDRLTDSLDSKASILPAGKLYYTSERADNAKWRKFLEPAFGSKLAPFMSQHPSAVLFITVSSRTFAIPFGFGHTLINAAKVVSDFGLMTALKVADVDTLRAVNYRTIDDRSRVGRIQVSEDADVEDFQLDTDTDLLRGVEAKSKDLSVCEGVAAGWSSIRVRTRTDAAGVPSLLSKLLNVYVTGKLPKRFEWIQNIRRIENKGDIQKRDALLLKSLNAGNFNGIRLALPEVVGIGDEMDARFQGRNGPAFTSDISQFMQLPHVHSPIDVPMLTASHVNLRDPTSGNTTQTYSIYRCIVAEFTDGNEMYLLNDGDWYRVDQDYAKKLDRALKKIPLYTHSFPVAGAKTEGAWNEDIAKNALNKCVLLDKSNIPFGGGRSKIEPCDLLTSKREWIHAKRRDTSSAGLCHLVSQAFGSSKLLHRDFLFRKLTAQAIMAASFGDPSIKKVLAKKLKSTQFNPAQWQVVLMILGGDRTNPATELPFLAKINIRKQLEEIGNMGFKTAIAVA